MKIEKKLCNYCKSPIDFYEVSYEIKIISEPENQKKEGMFVCKKCYQKIK